MLNVGCENGECTSVSIIVLAIGQQNGDDDVFVFSIDKVYLGGCDFSVEEVKNDRLVLPKLQFLIVIFSLIPGLSPATLTFAESSTSGSQSPHERDSTHGQVLLEKRNSRPTYPWNSQTFANGLH